MLQNSRPYWPEYLSGELFYQQGVKTLFGYLEQHSTEKPNDIAYIFYGSSITWIELLEKINKLAQYLHKKGVKKGSPVALFMQNSPAYIIGHFAIQKLGGIVVPLNPMVKDIELAYFFTEASIVGIICGDELYPLVRKAEERTEELSFAVTCHYLDFIEDPTLFPFPKELIPPKQTFPNADELFTIFEHESPRKYTETVDLKEDVGLMVFTSGTTGRPKGALLTYGNALFKAAASAQANDLKADDVLLACAPLCHIAGMLMGLNLTIYSGRPCVLFTRFDPVGVVEAIEKYRITYWYSIAPMNWAILQLPALAEKDLSSLRVNLATSFGMQVTKQLAEKWEAVTNGCVIYEAAYGLSETHTCDTFMPKDRVKFGSCGIPIYETEMKIVDPETGFEQQAGQNGEILIKSPGVFKGYFNRPEATAETLKQGWVHTGDIGYLDEDGYLFFLGRTKEMIKSSGYSIFPEDVEALLNDHPAIHQSAIIGVPDSKKGEALKAFIVLKEGFENKIASEDIIKWSKENMAAYKIPREVVFVNQLPATPSGKVLRKLLKIDRRTE